MPEGACASQFKEFQLSELIARLKIRLKKVRERLKTSARPRIQLRDRASLAVCVAQAGPAHAWGKDSVLFHLVEQRFVADFELQRSGFAVPLGRDKNALNDLGFGALFQ